MSKYLHLLSYNYVKNVVENLKFKKNVKKKLHFKMLIYVIANQKSNLSKQTGIFR